MKLELKAKHFEGTSFSCNGFCSIEKAYIEKTGYNCTEEVDSLVCLSTNRVFPHEWYGKDDFLSDMDKAQSHNWDETVIRTIELIEV